MTRRRLYVFNQSQNQQFQTFFLKLSDYYDEATIFTSKWTGHIPNKITFIKCPPYNRNSVTSRIRSWILFTARAIPAILRLPPGSEVLLVSNPPLVPLLLTGLGSRRARHVSLLVWDIYPEHAIAAGRIRHNGFFAKFWRKASGRAIAKSSACFTISAGMQMALEGHIASDNLKQKVVRIPMWVDTKVIHPISKDMTQDAPKNNTKGPVVMYAGNLGKSHDLDFLPFVVRELPGLRFVVIGKGEGFQDLKEKIGDIPNVDMLPPQDQLSFLSFLSAADIALVSQKAGTERLSFPSKTFTHLSSGSAILALTEPESDLAKMVINYKAGFVAKPHDFEQVRDALMKLVSDPETLAKTKAAARDAACKFHDVSEVASLVASLMRRGSGGR